MVVCTGTGRCGTGTFANVFGTHHEWHAKRLRAKSRRLFRHQAPWPSQHTRMITVEQYLEEAGPLDEFWDSSHDYVFYIDALWLLCSEIRIVYLIRDVPDFVFSWASRGGHMYRCWPWYPAPDDPARQEWDDWHPLVRSAWCWAYLNGQGAIGLNKIPRENYLVVRTKELYDDVDRIAAFTGLEPDAKIVASQEIYNAGPKRKHPSYGIPAIESWDAKLRRDIMRVAYGGTLGLCREIGGFPWS